MEDTTLSLKKVEDIPLTFQELHRMLGKDAKETNFWMYEQLSKLDMKQFLSKPAAIILIDPKFGNTSVGHFFAILHKGNTIEHFDPYGFNLNELFKITKQNTFLENLYKRTGKNIIYNPIKFQSLKNNSDTCGRWCVVRIKLKERTLNDFKIFIGQNVQTNDDKIGWLTYLL